MYLIGSDHCRKVLLAAQSSPQAAGVVFQAAEANERGADFLVAVTQLETREHGCGESQATTWRRTASEKLKAALTCASKESRNAWRYASRVTPGGLRPLAPSADRHRIRSDRVEEEEEETLTPHGAGGKDPPEMQRGEARHEDVGPASSGPVSLQGETDLAADEDCGDDEFRRRLAGPEGRRRRVGCGPGGALWMPASTIADGKGAAGNPSRRPKRNKVRRLVRHLEAGLKLKGRPGAGGLPAVGSQRVDLPYTKELAKWSYDEILGIPKTTVPGTPSDLL